MRNVLLTSLMLIILACSSCRHAGSRSPAGEASTASNPARPAEMAAARQPDPGDPAVKHDPTTPDRTASSGRVMEGAGLKVTIPASLDLWCGWIGEIPVKIENFSASAQDLILYARPPVNVFVNDNTRRPDQENEAIEVLRTSVAPGEIKEIAVELQSLRVGALDLPFSCLGRQASLQLNSPVIERGAYFMYRCWFEASEFYQAVWSNGSQELTPARRKEKIREIGRNLVREDMKPNQAEREAKRILLEEFKPAGHKLLPDWREICDQKLNRHPETYGFQYVDIDGLGWNEVEFLRGQYDWSKGDFVQKLWADHFGAEPFVRIELPPEWTVFEKNPSGTWGFFDPQNEMLMQHWGDYCAALAERYDGDGHNDAPGSYVVDNYILNNEPEGAWLNVDFDRDGWPSEKQIITKTDWWNDLQGQWGARAYAQKFGDLIFETTVRAARAIHQVNPQARVATPQFAPIGAASREMNDYLLKRGIARYVDAWGVHPGNGLGLLWQGNPQALWWLEDAINQAPPFSMDDLGRVKGALDREGQTLQTIQPLEDMKREFPFMGKLWRKLIDESFSQTLEDIIKSQAQYQADLPIWVTEQLTIGPLATNRRENLIAALRSYSICFHQKVETTVLAGFISANMRSANAVVDYLPDPTARELIVDIGRAIGGASPVAKFEAQNFKPGENEYLDYRWAVYKLFNRGNEDIIAIWSNSAKDEILDFDLQPGAQISKIRQIKYDAHESQFKKIETLSAIPTQLMVKPLRQFFFISVTSDRPKFGWLKNLQRRMSNAEREWKTQYQNTSAAVENAKRTIRGRGLEDAGRYRAIPRMLSEAEDALLMGNFNLVQQNLNEINQMISRL